MYKAPPWAHLEKKRPTGPSRFRIGRVCSKTFDAPDSCPSAATHLEQAALGWDRRPNGDPLRDRWRLLVTAPSRAAAARAGRNGH